MPNTRTSTASHTSTRGRTSSRAGSAARTEILNMLKEDHKLVKKCFRDFEKMNASEDAEACQALVKQTCNALKMHTTLEEELFYPAARSCLHEEDLIDEAEVEHATAKMLIERLQSMSPDDEKFSATFIVLGEYIKHHIREEENEMFPQLAHAKLDWQDLQGQIEERRQALMNEFMPDQGSNREMRGSRSEEEEDKSAKPRKAKGRSQAPADDDAGANASEPDLEGEEKPESRKAKGRSQAPSNDDMGADDSEPDLEGEEK